MKQFFFNCIYLFLLSTFFLLLSTNSYGQDFRNDYQVEYFLSENQDQLNTKVKFTITITNFRSDLYVKQFSIGFPKLFSIKKLKAFDDNGALTPKITSSDSITKIDLEFSNPRVGKNSLNNLYLEFYQDNLFNVNGNIWEVIIPTVSEKKDSSYKILVHLPENSNKKISISKPKPDSIYGDTIVWNNPQTKTVYAVFGESQYYKTELTYRVKNTKIVPVYIDVAFPPDTLYQKIYLDKINPSPEKVFSDDDGNYLGRYYLNPGQTKTIIFTGTIAVFSKLREDLVELTREKFSLQKNYLLSEEKYWKISQKDAIKDISPDIKDVYYFVTNKLQYNYSKINSKNTRLGADAILKNPSDAVCMEFTDLFIGIAREKGIYAREIEGYGFSQDPKLRPLSLVFDILHSWPEYYDIRSQIWVPVDPTWENTSGIDYLSSFDLNHVTFVIHGKDPEYPLAAGTYKTEDSRDVSIEATNKIPIDKKNLLIEYGRFPANINDTRTYQTKINITNNGNTYVLDKPIPIQATNLEINPTFIAFSPLAPYEKKTLTLSYKAKVKNKRTNAGFTINFPQDKLDVQLAIIPLYYELALKISIGLFLILFFFYLYSVFKKRLIKHK